MNIDFTQKLYKFNGEPLLEVRIDECGKAEIGGDLILRTVTVTALTDSYQDEKDLSAVDKIKRGELASKVFNSDSNGVDLSTDEIALIKKLVGKRFKTLIVWQTDPLFEGKEPKLGPKLNCEQKV